CHVGRGPTREPVFDSRGEGEGCTAWAVLRQRRRYPRGRAARAAASHRHQFQRGSGRIESRRHRGPSQRHDSSRRRHSCRVRIDPRMPRNASTISPLLEPQTLARLHGLELRARRIVEGYVAGLHRSPYRGFSNEFAEHREYAPGDDLRYVDWKVFGKSDRFYLKQFEEETNLLCYLLLDTSESMQYRGPHA